jgi:hypothetical protein
MGRCRYLLSKPDTGSRSTREPRINWRPGHCDKLGTTSERCAAGVTVSEPFRRGPFPHRERS